jgi:hypothetical protein
MDVMTRKSIHVFYLERSIVRNMHEQRLGVNLDAEMVSSFGNRGSNGFTLSERFSTGETVAYPWKN